MAQQPPGTNMRLSKHMKNLIYHFPTCYMPILKKEPIGELNLKRALDEDTGVFSSFNVPVV